MTDKNALSELIDDEPLPPVPRPQNRTLRRVVEYLDSIGIGLYGSVDLDTGEYGPGCRDYGPDDILKYRRMMENDEVWSADEK